MTMEWIYNWVVDTYGTDLLTSTMKMLVELLGFFVTSLVGTLIRENLFEEKANWRKAGGFAVLCSVLLLAISSKLTGFFGDSRILLAISVFSGLFFSLLSDSLKNGNIFKELLKSFKSKKDDAIDIVIDGINKTESIEEEIKKRVEAQHRADIEAEHRKRIEEEDRKREEDHKKYLQEEHLRREEEHKKTIEDEIKRRVAEELNKQ